MSRYHIEPLDERRAADLAQLMRLGMGSRARVGWWRRKYRQSAIGGRNHGFLAYHGSLPVACASLFPYRFELAGELLLGGQLGDWVALPAYRHTRAFKLVCDASLAAAEALGCHFLFGFSSDVSGPISQNRLAMRNIGRMDCFEIPLAPLAGVRRHWRRRLVAPLLWRRLPRDGRAWVSDTTGWGPLRDADYWRAKPTIHHLTLAGGVALIPGDILRVAALRGDTPVPLVERLAELVALGQRSGSRTLRFMVQTGDPLHAALTTLLGSAIPGWGIGVRTLRGPELPFDTLQLLYADYENI